MWFEIPRNLQSAMLQRVTMLMLGYMGEQLERLPQSRMTSVLTSTRLRRVAITLAVASFIATPIATFSPAVGLSHTPSAPSPATTGSVAANSLTRSSSTTWSEQRITAGGVTQWIECSGNGPLTVLVIAGLHADHNMWSLVLPSFAAMTRTCIYDRPGLGNSPNRKPHATVTTTRHATELHALLAAAGEKGPFIVVGHSYGGLLARTFTAMYRSRIAGLMLIEGVGPNDDVNHYWGEGGDLVDMWKSVKAGGALKPSSLRLVVEAAQDPNRNYWGGPSYGETPADLAQWRLHQREAVNLSNRATFVIVNHSAHVIEHDRPDAVIAGVRLLVTAIKGHHRLPACALGAYGVQPLC